MDQECPKCGQTVPTVTPTAERPGMDEDGLPFFAHHRYRDQLGWGSPELYPCPMSGRTTAGD